MRRQGSTSSRAGQCGRIKTRFFKLRPHLQFLKSHYCRYWGELFKCYISLYPLALFHLTGLALVLVLTFLHLVLRALFYVSIKAWSSFNCKLQVLSLISFLDPEPLYFNLGPNIFIQNLCFYFFAILSIAIIMFCKKYFPVLYHCVRYEH